MDTKTWKTDAGDGITLFCRSWIPDGNARARLVIVHGLAEHSGRYDHVARRIADESIITQSYDLRGHGQSQGKRTYIRHFEDHVDDLSSYMKSVPEVHPSLPIFLMGHSMGGAIAACYALEYGHTLNGLILSSAALKIHDDVPLILQKLSGIIARILPGIPTLKIDSRMISRDPAVVNAYNSDPLIYHGGTLARTGAEIIRISGQLQQRAPELRLPLYMFHGTADRIIDPSGSQLVYERSASSDKELSMYEGFYHETLNEPGKERVLNDLVSWINPRIIPPSSKK